MTESCYHLQSRGGWAEDAALKRCTSPIGPRNTWSNAAYALAGFGIYAAAPSNPTGILMALCVLLCFGSGLYHAYKTTYFNALDHVGMYAVFGALAVFGWIANPFLMLVVGFGVAWVGSFWRRGLHLDTEVGILLAIALVPVFLHDWRHGVVILGIYGIGYAVQRLDHEHSPLVGLWGHALWHIITAIAILLTALAQLAARL